MADSSTERQTLVDLWRTILLLIFSDVNRRCTEMSVWLTALLLTKGKKKRSNPNGFVWICIFLLSHLYFCSFFFFTSKDVWSSDDARHAASAISSCDPNWQCKHLQNSKYCKKVFYNACKSKTCTTNDFKLIWLLVKEKHRKKTMWWSCLACNLSPEFPCFSERELVLHECRLTLDAPSLHIVDEWFFGVKITFSVTLLSTRSSFNIPFQLNFFLPELNVINARYEQ